MMKNNCDICGVETFINPAREYEFKREKRVIKFTEEGSGEEKEMEVEHQEPVMSTVQRMNPFSGIIEEKPVHKSKDLQERSYYLQLTLGGEYVIRDVCRKCLDEHIMPLARPLWDKLASLIQKD